MLVSDTSSSRFWNTLLLYHTLPFYEKILNFPPFLEVSKTQLPLGSNYVKGKF